MKINLFVYADNMIYILMYWGLILFGIWLFSFSKTKLLFMVDVPYPLMGPYTLPLGLFGAGFSTVALLTF